MIFFLSVYCTVGQIPHCIGLFSGRPYQGKRQMGKQKFLSRPLVTCFRNPHLTALHEDGVYMYSDVKSESRDQNTFNKHIFDQNHEIDTDN